MSISERKDDFAHSLASIRRRHPGWQIALEGGMFVAVNRPAQTSQHIVVHETLAELDQRLDEIDGH